MTVWFHGCFDNGGQPRQNNPISGKALVLREDKEFGLEVVDLAKDPLAAGPLARSTTRNLNLDKALATGACSHKDWKTPAASAVPLTEKSLSQFLLRPHAVPPRVSADVKPPILFGRCCRMVLHRL
jgi:hypothetical protein